MRAPAPLGWPVVLLAELAVLAVAPALLALGALLSPVLGGRRPLRVVVIVVVYAAYHLAASAACGALWLAGGLGRRPLRRAHYGVLRWFVAGVTETAARCAEVQVRDTGSDEAHAVLAADGPVVVLARHAGEGDSLLVLHELLSRHRRRPRVVMHHALRADPLVAALGERLPNRFVDPRGGDTEAEIARLSSDLGPRDAVLIFPEGRNFSPEQRERAIARLERGGHDRQAQAARRMRHVSAPRPGGALAALAAAPGARVVVLAHCGFPTGARETWRRLPERQVVELRLWVADPPPESREDRIDWLFGWWTTVDEWIAGRMSPPPPGG